MTNFRIMKCPADLYALKHQLSLIPLQILHLTAWFPLKALRLHKNLKVL